MANNGSDSYGLHMPDHGRKHFFNGLGPPATAANKGGNVMAPRGRRLGPGKTHGIGLDR